MLGIRIGCTRSNRHWFDDYGIEMAKSPCGERVGGRSFELISYAQSSSVSTEVLTWALCPWLPQNNTTEFSMTVLH